jgi:hypothetical protein
MSVSAEALTDIDKKSEKASRASSLPASYRKPYELISQEYQKCQRHDAVARAAWHSSIHGGAHNRIGVR